MIDIQNLDENELKKNGIVFENSSDTQAFIEEVKDDMEIRVGNKISEGLSDKQLAEFDRVKDPVEAAKWLRKNKPDYKDIVKAVINEISEELIGYKDKILGLKKN